MKIATWMTAVLILVWGGWGKAQSGGVDTSAPQRVEIFESQSGQKVSVHKGDDVVVTFVASGGTGYSWQMEPTELATAKEEDVAQKPGLPGGPVKMMFHVKLSKSCLVTLRFNFSQIWEKKTPPARTFSVTLEVQ